MSTFPQHWREVALRHISVIPIRNGIGEAAQDQEEGYVRYIRTTDIADLHRLDESKRAGVPLEVAKDALVADDDILMTAAGSLGTSYLANVGEPAAFAGYLVRWRVDPTQCDARYFAWWTSSRHHLDQIATGAVRSTIDNFNASKFRSMRAPLPPLNEQRAIADFLDRETAQIDAMIEAQQGVVRALRERHEAGWARSYVRLTDNTPVRQVRNCVTSLVDGPFGSSLTSSHYTDEGTRVIRLGNIGVNAFKPQDAAFIDDEYAATLAEHAAEAGDVVMAGLGDSNQPLGRACVVPETLGPAIVKADCYRLRPRDGVYARYLAWALSSPPVLAQNSELARGITRQRMNTALAKSVRVAIPPMEAQVAVVERHDSETERLATAIDAALVVTELLHERREALITAAVTGRIDPTTGIERIGPTTEEEAS